MDSRADEATPYTNTDGDRAVPEVERDEFRGASVHLPGGKGFVKWMEEDQFSGLRGDNLFYPFSGDMELGLASFLSTSSLTMKEIDRFLSLEMVKKHLGPSLSFKSAKELRQRVELLPTGPKWSSKTITCAGFPTKKPIVLFYRNSLECIQFLIRNPLFKNHIDFVPTKLYQDQQQLHKEWINSESAWKMQEAIPAGRTVLGVVASSDKTNISVMNGDRMAHPLLLSLANLQMDVAMKASNHAFLMTALLPVVKFMCAKELRGVMESRLFHHCLDIVCAPLKLAARDGAIFSKSDGTRICASTWAAISAVNAVTSPDNVADYTKASKAHPNRLNGVHLPFWRDWPLSTNPSKFLTPEVLHHIHKAFFDHDFQWGRRLLGDAEIDFRLSLLHPRSGCRHFNEGVTRLKQLGGREHRELQRVFISIIADAVPPEVILALRGLMDLRFMAQAPQIDEDTLARMDRSLAVFHNNKQKIIDSGGREQDHFCIPKLEFLHGIVPSIRWAGVPMQYTADITEKAHSTQIKHPARSQTNHRDYDPQIVRHLDRAEKLRLFDLYTGIKTGHLKMDLEDVDEEDEADTKSLDNTGPSLTGESNRPVRNLFQAASLYPILFPAAETRFTVTHSTAFLLNRRPTIPKISIEDAAHMYGIADLRAAIGDYLEGQNAQPIIGGRRRNRPDCHLPFTDLELWSSLRLQNKSPHTSIPLPSQLVFAQPPCIDSTWPTGRYDAVLLSNDPQTVWPGQGFRHGLHGHTVAEIRLIMRPCWPKNRTPPSNPFLVYAQRFDLISQTSSGGRDPLTGQFLLRKACRTDTSRMGGIVDMQHIRTPIELVARFGAKADPRLTPYTSIEHSSQVRLNHYSNKELFWIFESVSLPVL
ncbi:hypothetical protein C8F01DRAFT_983641 [Mycena amicta]|nr:hypothetical protein C8F01DRAFT_983641 [Mycena amicta]